MFTVVSVRDIGGELITLKKYLSRKCEFFKTINPQLVYATGSVLWSPLSATLPAEHTGSWFSTRTIDLVGWVSLVP